MNGYTGKILRLDLSNRKISALDTMDYASWGGGHGMGSAIFFDLVKDKTIGAFDPGNVVTMMTSPLAGTLAPSTGRTEVQGIGPQSYPVEWFTRSNFGGRFAAMLKFAGWDGVVIEGRADKPVWVDVRNGEVRIRDADSLWGLDTWETQQTIWKEVGSGGDYSDWQNMGSGADQVRTTQRPAVIAIGPAGENLSRIAALIHDAGNGAGQGGFGGVWGSKNLKAISVIGTGEVQIADPAALMEGRMWLQKEYGSNEDGTPSFAPPAAYWQIQKDHRPQACFSCNAGCRARYGSGEGNEASCVVSEFYAQWDAQYHNGKQTTAYRVTDLAQKYGINAWELKMGLPYLNDLYKLGVLGPGKQIDTDLPMEQIGSQEFGDKFMHMIAYREGIGDQIAEGFYRASEQWGRLQEDTRSGLLKFAYWGYPMHYDPRPQVEWGYGSILGDRDINEHCFNALFYLASQPKWMGVEPSITAEEVATITASKLEPFEGDPLMLDYSTDNIYSEHMAKLVARHRHYTRFWKASALYCDLRFPEFINTSREDNKGCTGEFEPKFFNAVTGKNMSFADGVEVGRKIWNLDNAIWTLQGRHRDMVHFTDYIYTEPYGGFTTDFTGQGVELPYYMPGTENGEWKYISMTGRSIDRDRFEEWKTKYYALEGWNTDTGWPTKKTLESQGLAHVAAELEQQGKIGSENV